MEAMTIHLISVREHDGEVRARARVVAAQARISIEVWFATAPKTTRRELWREARDRVLRYLDPG